MIEFLLLGAMLAALFAELTGDSTLSSFLHQLIETPSVIRFTGCGKSSMQSVR
jgi:hypothetical protein